MKLYSTYSKGRRQPSDERKGRQTVVIVVRHTPACATD
jgi:hypothetical protein